ncbi:TniQ family protein [Streptomyces sp. NBC_00053]|uniref:TniQ family protein n=1 Tax=unclassified Streptomyces TaxID=2593676 RepID=UPI002253D7FB|nr:MULTISPECIES: TniQ family protein [unclassified Streptomyces]MCX5497935.1 TniQ family protein [Streptomyces sp. NBC_00052]MCX5553535.1 TniQ family protein [Streptomyces sp. NBC_00051]
MTTGANDADWLRLLPVRPRPKTGESTDSYVRRLARANHLKPSYLRAYLVGPPDYGRGKRPRADRLAAVTGRRQDTLERALPDLVRQKRTAPQKPKRSFTKSADKPALFAAIRRDAQAKQLPISHLAKRHHVSQATVRQALNSPTPPPRKKRPPIIGPAKERVGPTIDAILDEHATTHAGALPTVRLVWEKLLDEHDASASYGTVHRYMTAHPLMATDTSTRHLERAPGNYLATTQQTFHRAVFKHYRALLTAVRREPARHGLDGSFATMTAFVLGLDAGNSWNMLSGFQEWLVVRLGRGHDLTWPVLIRHLTPGGWVHPLTAQADTEAVITLHRLLGEFFDAREQPNGLAKIFRDYQEWLTTQAWHQFGTAEPDQIT